MRERERVTKGERTKKVTVLCLLALASLVLCTGAPGGTWLATKINNYSYNYHHVNSWTKKGSLRVRECVCVCASI